MTKFVNDIAANMLVCNEFDDQNGKISMTDTIYTDIDLSSNFTVLVLVNIYIQPDSIAKDIKRVKIHAFLREDKSKDFNVIYLGEFIVPPKNIDIKDNILSHGHRHAFNFEDFKFPNTGDYVVELFVDTSTDLANSDITDSGKIYESFYQKCDILGMIGFDVQIMSS